MNRNFHGFGTPVTIRCVAINAFHVLVQLCSTASPFTQRLKSAAKFIPFVCMPTFLLFTGCEDVVDGEGYVFDAKTKRPIEGVLVKSYQKRGKRKTYEREMTTDTTGYFYGSTGLVGCGGDCPDLLVEFIKDGYQTKEVISPSQDTVYLEN